MQILIVAMIFRQVALIPVIFKDMFNSETDEHAVDVLRVATSESKEVKVLNRLHGELADVKKQLANLNFAQLEDETF